MGVLFALVSLCLVTTQASANDVAPITSWTTGTSGPSRTTSGTDRLLVFFVSMESSSDRTITSATYGGRTLTPVINTSASGGAYARIYIYYLTDSQISLATSNTFSVSWSGSTDDVHYAARMFQYVDQSNPIRDFDSATTDSSTPNPIVTPNMTVEDGDYAVAGAMCGNANSYSWNNSFTEGTDQTGSTSQQSTAHRAITFDGSVAASATNSGPNRQVIVGAVLSNNTVPEPTIYYVRTDGDDDNTGLGSSSSQAWQTIRHATRFDDLEPGDIIYVRAGTYTERIQPDEDGASGLPIRVVADRTGSVSGWSAGEVNIVHDDEKVLELDGDDYWSFEGFRFQGKSDKETVKLKDSDGCVISSCEMFDGKTGIRAEGTMDAVITNCLIYDHTEDGIFVKDGGCTLEIWNTVIVDNSSDGIEQDNGTVTIRNSIVAYNSSDGLDINSGTMNHTYNLVYGNGDQQFEGTSISTGEISQNPQFEDASSSDYRLQASSPGIDAGTNASGTVDVDILGEVRPIGAGWDMGCYEFPVLGIWAFDEGSGGTSADDSGNGNDATLQGSTVWESARCGETVKLNGTSDWIDLGQIDLGTKSFTMGGWFRTSSATQQTIFAATATGTSNHAFYVELDADGHAQFVFRSPAASSGGTTLYSNDTYADGVWHYVAAVKSTTQLLLYIDGELVDVVSNTSSVHSSVDLVLGRHGKLLGQQYFNGSLDEVLLYGTAYSASQIAAQTGVVGRWRLDATSGSTALDSTVLGNSGSLSSGFTFGASSVSPAQISNGLEFDGSSDYISVPNSTSLQITNSLTITAWIKGDAWGSGSDADVILRKGEGNPNNYQLAIGDGRLSFSLDGSDPGNYQGDTILSTGQWYHVAATWDGSEVRLFVDGVMDHASPFSKSAPIGTDTRALYIGGRSGADLFNGVLDDVRLFNRALCIEEIEHLGHGNQTGGARVLKWIEIK